MQTGHTPTVRENGTQAIIVPESPVFEPELEPVNSLTVPSTVSEGLSYESLPVGVALCELRTGGEISLILAMF